MRVSKLSDRHVRVLRNELDTFLETPKTAMYDFHEVSHDTVLLLNVLRLGIDVCHDGSEKLYDRYDGTSVRHRAEMKSVHSRHGGENGKSRG